MNQTHIHNMKQSQIHLEMKEKHAITKNEIQIPKIQHITKHSTPNTCNS